MKNIFSIFINDLKNVARNIIVFIVIIGISILPALYAWFNIAANWDPYSNTGGIPFAVCSNDKGASYKFLISFNAGDKIIDNLKKNDKMGWDFVDENSAIDGVKSGKYYAAVVIPENFSENLMSVLSGEFKQAELQYYVNEKKNAVAPKITNKGIEAIEESINSTYVDTITTKIASTLNLASGSISKSFGNGTDSVINAMKDIQNNIDSFNSTVDIFISSIDTVETVIDSNKNNLPNIDQTLLKAGLVTENVKDSLNSAKDVSSSVADSIDSILASAEGFSDTAAAKINEAFDLIETDSAKAADILTEAIESGEKIIAINKSVVDSLKKLDSSFGLNLSDIAAKLDENTEKWESVNSSLTSAANSIRTKGTYIPEDKNKIASLLSTADTQITKIKTAFSEISTALDEANKKVTNATEKVNKISVNIGDIIEGLLASAEGFSSSAKLTLDDAFAVLSSDSAKAAERLNKAAALGKKVTDIDSKVLFLLQSIENKTGLDLSAITVKLDTNIQKWEDINNKIFTASETIRTTGSLPEKNKQIIFSLIDEAASQASALSEAFKNVKESVNTAAQKLSTSIINAKDVSDSISYILASVEGFSVAANERLDSIAAEIEAGTVTASDGLTAAAKITEIVAALSDKSADALRRLAPDFDFSKLTSTLENINNSWNDTKTSLTSAADTIRQKGSLPQQNKDDLIAFLKNADSGLSNARSSFSNIKSSINTAIDKVFGVVESASGFLYSLSDDIPDFGNTLDKADTTLENMKKTLENVKTFMENSKTKINSLISNIEMFKNKDIIGSLINPIIVDPQALGDFVSSPAKSVENRVYPVENYGAGMTPFYSSLAFWVGGIILVAVMRTDLKNKELKNLDRPNSTQLFFGRYFIFFFLGQIQALIISLGDLLFLKIQCENPVLFIVSALISSFVYTLLIYSLTITFSVIGKALAVIILVIQIAGSGGTFPIEVLPEPFQAVSPFLPFKYGINMLREAVAGVDAGAYINDLLLLLAFVPAALLLGLLMRRPCIGIISFFNKRIEQSDIVI